MSKIGLFLCFLLAFAHSSIIDGVDTNEFYDKFIQIAKGMADSTAYKCASSLSRHRTKILETIEKVLKDVKGGKSMTDALISNAVSLIFLDGFADDCNVGTLIAIVPDLLKVEGIKKIGTNMVNNAADIEAYISEFMGADNLDAKLLAIGKIIKSTTGIVFH